MTETTSGTYQHTQKAPLGFFLYVPAVILLFTAWAVRNEPAADVALPIVALLMVVLGASFQQLTVADEGHRLAIRFGPLPLFRKRIWYDDIRQVEVGRTMFIDGWGINLSLRGGWVWNIWGRDCVVLRLRRGTLRVGTDDPQNLASYLNSKISPDTT